MATWDEATIADFRRAYWDLDDPVREFVMRAMAERHNPRYLPWAVAREDTSWPGSDALAQEVVDLVGEASSSFSFVPPRRISFRVPGQSDVVAYVAPGDGRTEVKQITAQERVVVVTARPQRQRPPLPSWLEEAVSTLAELEAVAPRNHRSYSSRGVPVIFNGG